MKTTRTAEEIAQKLKEEDVLYLANNFIEDLKRSYRLGVEIETIDIEELEIQEYTKYDAYGMEVMQYWVITSDLGERLAEYKTNIVVPMDDGYYLWGRTGYGYDMADDFIDVAEDILAEIKAL